MLPQVQLIGITPDQLQNAILQGVKNQIDELKKEFQPKKPETYLTRKETAELLKVDYSTLHNWKHKGKLNPVAIGGRVLYKRSDIEKALIQL